MGNKKKLKELKESKSVKARRTDANGCIAKPTGLYNVGNTCYFNSVCQCLRNTQVLADILPPWSSSTHAACLKRNGEKNCISSLELELPLMEHNFTATFLDVVDSFMKPPTTGVARNTGAVSPTGLHRYLTNHHSRFQGFGQHDSHDALCALLDSLKQDELKRWQKGILTSLQISPKKITDEERTAVRNWGRTASTATVVDRVFGGVILTSLRCCVCHTIRQNFEHFLNISLPISFEKPSTLKKVAKAAVTLKSKHGKKQERKAKGKKRLARRDHRLSQLTNDHFSDETEDGDDASAHGCHVNPVTLHEVAQETTTSPDSATQRIAQEDEAHSLLKVSPHVGGTTEGTIVSMTPLSASTSETPSPGLQRLVTSTTTTVGSSRQGSSSSLSSERNSTKANSTDGADLEDNADDYSPSSSSSRDQHTIGSGRTSPGLEQLVSKLEATQLDGTSEEGNAPPSEQLQANQLAQEPLWNASAEGHAFATDLERCLARYTGSELLSGPNKTVCTACSGEGKCDSKQKSPVYSDAVKRDIILKPPPILIMHLKRFERAGIHLQKIQKSISFPLVLDLTPFCSKLCWPLPGERILYRLYGVVEHSGRMSGGHYVAYVAVSHSSADTELPLNSAVAEEATFDYVGSLPEPEKWPLEASDLVQRLRRCDRYRLLRENGGAISLNGGYIDFNNSEVTSAYHNGRNGECEGDEVDNDQRNWFYCSDTHVTSTTLATVLSSQAYMLFYERIA